MNITLDLILPPILVAMLIGMVFASNALIMESTVESRINNNLQFTASELITVIQEEVRGMREFLDVQDDEFSFISFAEDTVTVRQSDRDMIIERVSQDGTAQNPEIYAGRLWELNFETPGVASGAVPSLLRVTAVTESEEAEEARKRSTRIRAVAQRDIYLRSLHITNQI